MKVDIKGFSPTTSQQLLLNALHTNQKNKYICCAWSRQQGKTTVMLYKCVCWLLQRDEEIIYFTPTFTLAKNIYSKLIKLFPEQLVVKANSADLILTTKTGSIIRFFSGEAAQSARGSNCTRLIVDEAAYIKDEIDGQSFWYNICLPLLKARGKNAILISTPFAKSGFFYELCMRGFRGEEGYKYIKRTIYEDGLITPEEIEELKKGYPEMAWKCEFECEFMSNAMSVFPEYEDNFKDNFNFDKNQQCWCGVDLSTVGTDNTVVTIVNASNQVLQHIIKGDLDDKYKQIANLINQYKPVGTYIESNSIGAVMFNEIKKLTKLSNIELFTTTNESKKQYISLISNAITNDNISFDKNNKILYSEFGTFSYKLTKAGNVTYAATSGNHDDTVISLGLSLQAKENFKFVNQVHFQPRIKRNLMK